MRTIIINPGGSLQTTSTSASLLIEPGYTVTAPVQSFTNSGTLTVSDAAVLDLRAAQQFAQSGSGAIVQLGSGRVRRNAMGLAITSSDGNPVAFSFGNPLYVTLVDQDENVRAAVPDETFVKVVNMTNGDEEVLQLIETGNNTAFFRNPVAMPAVISNHAVVGNGQFEGNLGDSIQVRYVDPQDPPDIFIFSVNAPNIHVDPADVDFGSHLANTGPTPKQTVTIFNTGDMPLTISGIEQSVSSAFSIINNPGIGVLNSGDTILVDLVFNPTSAGPVIGELVIESNDPHRPRLEVPLTGTGILPVGAENRPPEFGFDSAPFTVISGETFEFSFMVSDPEGDDVTITTSHLPPGMIVVQRKGRHRSRSRSIGLRARLISGCILSASRRPIRTALRTHIYSRFTWSLCAATRSPAGSGAFPKLKPRMRLLRTFQTGRRTWCSMRCPL